MGCIFPKDVPFEVVSQVPQPHIRFHSRFPNRTHELASHTGYPIAKDMFHLDSLSRFLSVGFLLLLGQRTVSIRPLVNLAVESDCF